jgi:hypothetical protein
LGTFRIAGSGDFRFDCLAIDGVVKAIVADRHVTVLPHLILLQHLLDLSLDGLAAMQPAPAYHPRNSLQLSGRSGQQGVPFGRSTISNSSSAGTICFPSNTWRRTAIASGGNFDRSPKIRANAQSLPPGQGSGTSA